LARATAAWLAVAEHALSVDFATRIAAAKRKPAGARATPKTARPRCPARKPCEKRLFRNSPAQKTTCQSARMCYFPAPILIARLHAHRVSKHLNPRGADNMAKKGGAPTKSEVLTHISKETGLARKQVGTVFESLGGVIKKSLRGNGLFTLPGLLKMKVVKKPATKAREGVNPFTGEKMMFKAKPASKKVRVMPLKNLKAMVNS
jgi:DNA-binding protein HU-beta